MSDARRIKPNDVLAMLWTDLQASAREAQASCELFKDWFVSCVDLLAQVPDDSQRMSWAYGLASKLDATRFSVGKVVAELLTLSTEVRNDTRRRTQGVD